MQACPFTMLSAKFGLESVTFLNLLKWDASLFVSVFFFFFVVTNLAYFISARDAGMPISLRQVSVERIELLSLRVSVSFSIYVLAAVVFVVFFCFFPP